MLAMWECFLWRNFFDVFGVGGYSVRNVITTCGILLDQLSMHHAEQETRAKKRAEIICPFLQFPAAFTAYAMETLFIVLAPFLRRRCKLGYRCLHTLGIGDWYF